MIKVAVCDDDEMFLKRIKKLLKGFSEKCKFLYFNDSCELLKRINNNEVYDIYLLDIEMPRFDGMQLASVIKQRQEKAIVMFLTSYEDYVFFSFRINIFRYIRKNYIDEELINDMNSALQEIECMEKNKRNYIYIKNSTVEEIKYSDIIYIRKAGKNIEINLYDNSVRIERKTISQIFDELASEEFIYSDKGTVVNIINISKLENNKLFMVNGAVLYTSRLKVKDINLRILKYWGQRM